MRSSGLTVGVYSVDDGETSGAIFVQKGAREVVGMWDK